MLCGAPLWGSASRWHSPHGKGLVSFSAEVHEVRERESESSRVLSHLRTFPFNLIFFLSKPALKSPASGVTVALESQPKAESNHTIPRSCIKRTNDDM